MPGMTYTLNETEQALAQIIARERYSKNRDAGTTNRPLGTLKQEQRELNGIGGELAFAALHNVYPDMTTHVRHGGADAIVLGRTVDVKTSRYPDGDLMVLKIVVQSVECYALMVGMFPTFAFRGWASPADIFRNDRLTDCGYGPSFAVKQRELHDTMWDF